MHFLYLKFSPEKSCKFVRDPIILIYFEQKIKNYKNLTNYVNYPIIEMFLNLRTTQPATRILDKLTGKKEGLEHR